MPPQKVRDKKVDRKDHVWYPCKSKERDTDWICVLCGAVCATMPPYPTPQEWMPLRYDRLTVEVKALCPCPRVVAF